MSTKDKTVRDAAAKLHEAITEAKADGYAVTWPATIEGLKNIAVSATGKVKTEAPAKTTRK